MVTISDVQPTKPVMKGLSMPFAGYKNFDACVAANKDKDNPEAYCAVIQKKVEKKQ